MTGRPKPLGDMVDDLTPDDLPLLDFITIIGMRE